MAASSSSVRPSARCSGSVLSTRRAYRRLDFANARCQNWGNERARGRPNGTQADDERAQRGHGRGARRGPGGQGVPGRAGAAPAPPGPPAHGGHDPPAPRRHRPRSWPTPGRCSGCSCSRSGATSRPSSPRRSGPGADLSVARGRVREGGEGVRRAQGDRVRHVAARWACPPRCWGGRGSPALAGDRTAGAEPATSSSDSSSTIPSVEPSSGSRRALGVRHEADDVPAGVRHAGDGLEAPVGVLDVAEHHPVLVAQLGQRRRRRSE